jgi:hypothetical protein
MRPKRIDIDAFHLEFIHEHQQTYVSILQLLHSDHQPTLIMFVTRCNLFRVAHYFPKDLAKCKFSSRFPLFGDLLVESLDLNLHKMMEIFEI